MLVGNRPGELLAAMQNDGVLRFVVDRLNVLNPALFSVLDHPLLRKHSLSQRLAVLLFNTRPKRSSSSFNPFEPPTTFSDEPPSFTNTSGTLLKQTHLRCGCSATCWDEASDHLRTLQVLGEHELHLHGIDLNKDASAALISK